MHARNKNWRLRSFGYDVISAVFLHTDGYLGRGLLQCVSFRFCKSQSSVSDCFNVELPQLTNTRCSTNIGPETVENHRFSSLWLWSEYSYVLFCKVDLEPMSR